MKPSEPYRSSMNLRKSAGTLRRPLSSTRAGACPNKTLNSIRFSLVQWQFVPLLATSVHKFPRGDTCSGARPRAPAAGGGRRYTGALQRCDFLEVFGERDHAAARLLPVVVLVRRVVPMFGQREAEEH